MKLALYSDILSTKRTYRRKSPHPTRVYLPVNVIKGHRGMKID